jgi:post-segregation antitoxin (ccd killing protein)
MAHINQSHSVTVRMKESMYQDLMKRAELVNVNLSEYIRAIITKEIKEQNEIQKRYGYTPADRVLQ